MRKVAFFTTLNRICEMIGWICAWISIGIALAGLAIGLQIIGAALFLGKYAIAYQLMRLLFP